MEIFGVSLPGLMSQLLLGLVNGSFYAILSLGLAVIFGLLNVINFAHGALFMLGAMVTWMAMSYFNINYWVMLVLSPLLVGLLGVLIERFLLRWIYKLDHLYGLLLTLGLSLLIEGLFRSVYGVSGLGYDTPERSEEHTSELQSPCNLVCRLLLEKKKNKILSRKTNELRLVKPSEAQIKIFTAS